MSSVKYTRGKRSLEFESEFARIVVAKAEQRGISLRRVAMEMHVQYRTLRRHMRVPEAKAYVLWPAAAAWLGVTEESLRQRVFFDNTFPLASLPTSKARAKSAASVEEMLAEARKKRERAKQLVNEARGLELRAKMALPPKEVARG